MTTERPELIGLELCEASCCQPEIVGVDLGHDDGGLLGFDHCDGWGVAHRFHHRWSVGNV